MSEKLTISQILNSIQKNLKAPKDKKNNFGNFAYRNAEGILEAYKEEIKNAKYPDDLTLTHKFSLDLIGSRLFAKCTSILKLSDGTKEEAEGFAEIDISKKGMDQAQLSGAVTSYSKKYALCNLFAIDDSKHDPDADDPDADEKTKNEPRNAFGLKRDSDLAKGDDMKETLNKKNEQDFAGLKAIIENCGGEEELKEVWTNKENAKIIKSLQKWRPELYEKLIEAKDFMKESFVA